MKICKRFGIIIYVKIFEKRYFMEERDEKNIMLDDEKMKVSEKNLDYNKNIAADIAKKYIQKEENEYGEENEEYRGKINREYGNFVIEIKDEQKYERCKLVVDAKKDSILLYDEKGLYITGCNIVPEGLEKSMYNKKTKKEILERMVKKHYKDYYKKVTNLTPKQIVDKLIKNNIDIGVFYGLRALDKVNQLDYSSYLLNKQKGENSNYEKEPSIKKNPNGIIEGMYTDRLEYSKIFLKDIERKPDESKKQYELRAAKEREKEVKELGIDVEYDLNKIMQRKGNIFDKIRLIRAAYKSNKTINSSIIGLPFAKKREKNLLLNSREKVKALNAAVEKVKDDTKEIAGKLKIKGVAIMKKASEKGQTIPTKFKAYGKQARKMVKLCKERTVDIAKQAKAEVIYQYDMYNYNKKQNDNMRRVEKQKEKEEKQKIREERKEIIEEKKKIIGNKIDEGSRIVDLAVKAGKENVDKKIFDSKIDILYAKQNLSKKFKAVGENTKKMRRLINQSKENFKGKLSNITHNAKRKLTITGMLGVAALSLGSVANNIDINGAQNSNMVKNEIQNDVENYIDLSKTINLAGLNIKNPIVDLQQKNEQKEDVREDFVSAQQEFINEDKVENNLDDVQQDEINDAGEQENIQQPELVNFDDAMIDALEIGVGSEFSIKEGEINTQADGKGTKGDYKNTGEQNFKIDIIAAVVDGKTLTFDGSDGKTVAQIKAEYPGAEISYHVYGVGWNNENENDIKSALINKSLSKMQLNNDEKSDLINGKTSGQIDKNSQTLNQIKQQANVMNNDKVNEMDEESR